MKKNIIIGIMILFFNNIHSQSNNNPKISPVHAGAYSSNRLNYIVGKIYVLSTPLSNKNSQEKNDNIKIYPNPVKDILSIETLNKQEIKSIAIYDMSGKELYNGKIENNSINLSYLKQGVYTIKLDNDNSKTFKIIKN